MISVENLNVKVFADGADLTDILEMNSNPLIKGLTTNPTLMRKAGVTNYKEFAIEVLNHVKGKPISFEVFSDDLEEMKYQGDQIASWGNNVYVKIPIMNTLGTPTTPVIEYLVNRGVKVNVTAIMTTKQVKEVTNVLRPDIPSYVSVFAGRIADTGRDPLKVMSESIQILKESANAELIWASPREILNVFQAEEVNCHIITATSDILKKIELIGKDLEDYSLETVKMFRSDAVASGYEI
jgi:transaldolase